MPNSPLSALMAPSNDTIDRVLQVASNPHTPVPSTFTSGGCCCVDCLTLLNYTWTTDVQVLSRTSDGLVISYGRGSGVRYYATREEGPNAVIVVSTLSSEHAVQTTPFTEAGTLFELVDGVLRMTYLRFGAKAEFILAGEVQETSKREILERIRELEKLE